ncbi:hypothetical protein [Paenibacillus sp. PL2-23]|uniref:hypothetical protein n=1 Tax=Paenibacillus sp. PL2-23 TaxID=2100729 RepID=UPI0030FA3D20
MQKGLEILNLLKKYGYLPEKMGLYEPIRTDFNEVKFLEFWTKEEEGCYQEGIGYVAAS